MFMFVDVSPDAPREKYTSSVLLLWLPLQEGTISHLERLFNVR